MKTIDRLLQGYVLLVFALLYAPIAVLVLFSFNSSRFMTQITGFTLKWYEQLFENERVWTAFLNTIWSAALVTLVSVFLGILVASVQSRFKYTGKTLIDAFIYIPIVIPEITESLSLLLMYVMLDVPLGAWTVVLGHIAFDISFAEVVIRARMAGYDTSVEQAARTLGANEVQTFLKVTLPVLMPGIVAGAFMAFSMSFTDFVKTQFTRGPGFSTLPVVIWTGAARGGVSPELNALSAFTLMVALVLAFSRSRMERELY